MDKDSEEYKEFRKKRNEANRRYYNKPDIKVRRKIYKKEYDKKNKFKISEYCKKYSSKPEVKTRIKKWREDNKEHLRLKGIEYRKKNRIRLNKQDKLAYHKKNTPEFRTFEMKRAKKFREENKDLIKQYKRKYNKSPKGKLTATKYVHKRLSRIHGSKFTLTKKQIKEIKERDKVCVYCGSSVKLELDHIIPLSKKGDGIFYNFVIACSKCNKTKSNIDVFKWCQSEKIEVPKIVLEGLYKMKRSNI